VGHIDLRDLEDDDLDAVFDMIRDAEAAERTAFAPADPHDRGAFDEWVLRRRNDPGVSLLVVTEDGAFAGVAAAFTVDGEREITACIARSARGRGVGSAALRLLVSREADRPLYARVAAGSAASLALLTKLGFTEVSRTTEEIVLALPPTLE
jgi:RimJ/RimL family protein N-acetyltransferase